MKVICITVVLVAINVGMVYGDWEIPRATDVTATQVMVECLDENSCGVLTACTVDLARTDFHDADFATVEGSPIQYSETLLTPLVIDEDQRCVLRVHGDANITGFRYARLKGSHSGFHFSGIAEIPIHRARSVSQVVIPVVPARNLLDVYLAHPLVPHDSAASFIDEMCNHIKEGHEEYKNCEEHEKQSLYKLKYTIADDFSSCLLHGYIDSWRNDTHASAEDFAYWAPYQVADIMRSLPYTCKYQESYEHCYGCREHLPNLD